MDDEMMPEMPPEEDPMFEEMEPAVGAFQRMMTGNMPGPAELADLLGEGSSFEDNLGPAPMPLNQRMSGMEPGPSLGPTGEPGADFTGQKSYDPEEVKRDVRALLGQKAKERAAATDEFQSRAQSLVKGQGY